MGTAQPIGLWLLPILCLAGFAVSFYFLAQQAGDKRQARLLVASAEIGVGAGAFFWLVLRWLGFGSGMIAPLALGQAAVRAVIWGIVAYPFSVWRLERSLKLPYYRAAEVATWACGVMLLLFFIIVAAAVIISYFAYL